ncbi:DUF3566 domain-containing protein [Citricoccus nitrophenolicus]|uniref:DUF3566 domain-containing protein n=1 Tax=Citricoccus nitrophenolicus TaxID=863575 RepID=A0ABV0IFJ5_9MICC|nr:DUF3566 domain-containing protein [Citricoccus sp. I39-566]WMY78851.1 DUF3566 domain-containing protein [Citricoccus sp. I39-566]
MSTSGTPRSGGQRPAGGSSAQGAAPRGQQRPPSQGARQGSPRTQGSRPTGTGASRPQRPTQRPTQQGLVRPAPKAKVRKARLLVSKVDPWSVLKMAFLLSVALGIVTVVGAVVLWTVMDLTGIFDQVNDLLAQVLGSEGGSFTVQQLISLGQVASFATIIAVVNVVLLTALSMLAAVLYNISSTLVGGIGVTLTDD